MKNTNETITRQTPFGDLPELLRPKEVRAFTGVGRKAVYGAIKSGELPHRKIGGVIFIPKAALMEVSVA